MKKAFTITLILLGYMTAMGQTNNRLLTTSYIGDTLRLQSTFNLQPPSYIFTEGINGKALLKINIPQNRFPIDSLIIYVRKSQIRWLNDSTAIIYKP